MRAILAAAVIRAFAAASLHAQGGGSISGMVVGIGGVPLAGVSVTASGGPNGPVAEAKTDAAGKYRFEGAPPGVYVLSAKRDGETAVSVRAAGVTIRIEDEVTISAGAMSLAIGESIRTLPPREPGSTRSRLSYMPMLAGAARLEIAGGSETVDIVLLPSAVRVQGRLVAMPRLPLAFPLKVSLTGTTVPVLATVELRQDGTFEFPLIPPGRYLLRMDPNMGTASIMLTVGDRNLSEVELAGKGTGVRVSGSLAISDKDAQRNLVPKAISLTNLTPRPPGAREPSDLRTPDGFVIPEALTGLFSPDGRFELLSVPPGEYLVRIVPEMEVANATITVGSTDLEDIQLNEGVRVRGEVVASNFGLQRPERITLTGPDDRTVGTSITADRTFEFPKVGPGTYHVLLDGRLKPTPAEITVGKEDTLVKLAAPFDAGVTGRVSYFGVGAPPESTAAIQISMGNGYGATVKLDGSFEMPSGDGEFPFFVTGLPEGYIVKSMFHGSENLMIEPAKVDASRPNIEILITLERTQ